MTTAFPQSASLEHVGYFDAEITVEKLTRVVSARGQLLSCPKFLHQISIE